MNQIALVTYAGSTELTDDGQLLVPALRQLGVEAKNEETLRRSIECLFLYHYGRRSRDSGSAAFAGAAVG